MEVPAPLEQGVISTWLVLKRLNFESLLKIPPGPEFKQYHVMNIKMQEKYTKNSS